MPSAMITSKGQITIPKPIRLLLKVRSGDRLDFLVDQRGQVVLRAGGADVTELRGLLRQPGRRPVSVPDMNKAIARRHGSHK